MLIMVCRFLTLVHWELSSNEYCIISNRENKWHSPNKRAFDEIIAYTEACYLFHIYESDTYVIKLFSYIIIILSGMMVAFTSMLNHFMFCFSSSRGIVQQLLQWKTSKTNKNQWSNAQARYVPAYTHCSCSA